MKNKKLILKLLAIPVLLLFTACVKNGPSANPGKQQNKEFSEVDYEQMITPNNELGIHLLSKVDADDDGNLFISPTSLVMALSMIYNGAEGDTKGEIERALQMEGIDAETLNKANASLMNSLQKESKSIQLAIANSMWLNDSFHFQDEFAVNNQEYFNAEIEEINIHDDESAKKINDWVKKSTNDKITKMVDAPLNPNMVAYLLNAIYFKGDWAYPFDKEATENRPFYLKDGTTKNVPLMTLNEELSYVENDRFQAVKLPYGDGEMSMRVFLPKEDTTIDEFKNELTLENWEAWNDSFEVTQGMLKLPKFQLDYEVLLNDALEQLGMKLAFSDQADFSKIIQEDEPLWISLVKQKTYIDVDEEGTEAAAVTGVEVVMESLPVNEPFTMEVNRPFFIVIMDEQTGAIVFMGIVSNPESK